MKIYLLRHAIAEKSNIRKYPNDDRPLSRKGKDKMLEISKGLAEVRGKIDRIYCSPLKRSAQTAHILKKYVRFSKKILVTNLLFPDAKADPCIKFLSKLNSASVILLVGHEPFISNFISSTTGLKQESSDFKKGGLSLIMLEKDRKPVLKEIITPNLLIRLGLNK